MFSMFNEMATKARGMHARHLMSASRARAQSAHAALRRSIPLPVVLPLASPHTQKCVTLTRDAAMPVRAATRPQAHLVERLSRGSAWTVFAPTDAAFMATLNALGLSKSSLMASKELLEALVRMHIVAAKLPSTVLRPGAEVATLEGSRLRVRVSGSSAGGVKVAGASLLRADIPAENGVIHGVAQRLLRSALRRTVSDACLRVSAPTAQC
jgi:uncharacterized surface protein with fasciclin (FAS1) repeats